MAIGYLGGCGLLGSAKNLFLYFNLLASNVGVNPSAL